MNWYRNMKLGAKLIVGFALVALITGIVGTLGIYNLSNTNDEYSKLYEDFGIPLGYIANASIDYQQIRVELRNIVLAQDSEKREAIVKKIENYDSAMQQELDKFKDSLKTKEGNTAYTNLLKALADYKPAQTEIIKSATAGDLNKAETILFADSSAKLVNDVMQHINELFESKDSTGKELSEQYTNQNQTTIITLIIIVIFGIVLAMIFGIVISRMISKPIVNMVGVAKKVAEGDLSVDINHSSKDEIGILAQAINKMTNNLNDVMYNITVAAEQVSAGSTQLSDSSMALSQGATEQASSISELSASVEEIASQTRVNADNAKEANRITESTRMSAIEGNNQMKEMLKAMEDINDASMGISKIIKVIDDIAFQTNILALNAAVEAARAGQHGKGFAVVAEEVRNLAARSSNAAKETTDMIESSIKKSEGGTKIANETASALNKIVEGIANVADIINNIDIASNEQSAGIEQINQGILQVTTVVQTNSATSEESAAASEELASQAILLEDQVAKFKLKNQNANNVHSDFDRMSARELVNKKKPERLVEKERNSKKILLSDKDFGKY